MAAYSELFLEQYADFSTYINVDDLQGDAINLTGYSASSQMRKSYYSSTAYDFVVEISDAGKGEITLSMDAANTANMSPGRYVYDLNITDTDSVVTRVVEGIVVVSPGATRNGG
jgi:hypothetical protein